MLRLIFVFVFAISNISVAKIITHSHCPNHTRNNSDNMHTHDTSDPDHNAKHVSGHPHTWEFDEFCPKGTERGKKKKRDGDTSPPKGGEPRSPGGDESPGGDDSPGGNDNGGGGAAVFSGGDDTDTSTPVVSQRRGEVPKPLRITSVRIADGVLSVAFEAIHENSTHNYLYIVIDGYYFHTPAMFFGYVRFSLGETREVAFTPKTFNGTSVCVVGAFGVSECKCGSRVPVSVTSGSVWA